MHVSWGIKKFLSVNECNKINNERDFRGKFGFFGKGRGTFVCFKFYLSRADAFAWVFVANLLLQAEPQALAASFAWIKTKEGEFMLRICGYVVILSKILSAMT